MHGPVNARGLGRLVFLGLPRGSGGLGNGFLHLLFGRGGNFGDTGGAVTSSKTHGSLLGYGYTVCERGRCAEHKHPVHMTFFAGVPAGLRQMPHNLKPAGFGQTPCVTVGRGAQAHDGGAVQMGKGLG